MFNPKDINYLKMMELHYQKLFNKVMNLLHEGKIVEAGSAIGSEFINMTAAAYMSGYTEDKKPETSIEDFAKMVGDSMTKAVKEDIESAIKEAPRMKRVITKIEKVLEEEGFNLKTGEVKDPKQAEAEFDEKLNVPPSQSWN
jgi:hypothetical protein